MPRRSQECERSEQVTLAIEEVGVELGPKLRMIRTTQGVTLQQLADQTKLSKSFVSQVESGTANPSIASLKRLVDALGVTLAELFEGSTNGAHSSSPTGQAVRLHSHTQGSLQPRVVRSDRRKMLVFPGPDLHDLPVNAGPTEEPGSYSQLRRSRAYYGRGWLHAPRRGVRSGTEGTRRGDRCRRSIHPGARR